jgi:hypothetical protein
MCMLCARYVSLPCSQAILNNGSVLSLLAIDGNRDRPDNRDGPSDIAVLPSDEVCGSFVSGRGPAAASRAPAIHRRLCMQVMRDLYHHVENTAYHRLEKSGGASAKQLAAKNEWEKSVRTNRAHANGHPLPGSTMSAKR